MAAERAAYDAARMTTAQPTLACALCGAGMSQDRSTYDKAGNLVCPGCAATGQIAEGDARAVSSVTKAAIGVAVAGVLSWTCLNMFFVLSVVTVAGGISWLVMVSRAPSLRARLEWRVVPCVLAVISGVVLAGMPLLFLALGITAGVLGG
jgi:hypothetical protein